MREENTDFKENAVAFEFLVCPLLTRVFVTYLLSLYLFL